MKESNLIEAIKRLNTVQGDNVTAVRTMVKMTLQAMIKGGNELGIGMSDYALVAGTLDALLELMNCLLKKHKPEEWEKYDQHGGELVADLYERLRTRGMEIGIEQVTGSMVAMMLARSIVEAMAALHDPEKEALK